MPTDSSPATEEAPPQKSLAERIARFAKADGAFAGSDHVLLSSIGADLRDVILLALEAGCTEKEVKAAMKEALESLSSLFQ